MAVVVRPSIPANLGRIVRVVGPYRGPPHVRMHGTNCIWLIEAAHPLTWDADGHIHQDKQGPAPDEALQPIRGIPWPDSHRQSRPVNVHAGRL
jgi:hypothetical protein